MARVIIHRQYGRGDEARIKAQRYAKSATRQARPGISYQAIEGRDGWHVARIDRSPQG